MPILLQIPAPANEGFWHRPTCEVCNALNAWERTLPGTHVPGVVHYSRRVKVPCVRWQFDRGAMPAEPDEMLDAQAWLQSEVQKIKKMISGEAVLPAGIAGEIR